MKTYNITVSYQDRRGASCTRSFDDKVSAVAFIARLRCEAIITDGEQRKIGEVYYLQNATKRRKWGWWIDPDSLPESRDAAAKGRRR